MDSSYYIRIAYLARIVGRKSPGLYSSFRKCGARILKKGRIYYVQKVDAIEYVMYNENGNLAMLDSIRNTY